MTPAPDATDHVDGPTAVPTKARTPRARAGASYLGALLSLGLIAAGAVGIRDGVLAAGWITGSSWTGAAVGWVDGLEFAPWMTFAGIGAAIIGLGFVVVAVKPRRQTSVEVSARSSVVMAYTDVARAAVAAANAVPGVVDARATATRKRLRINARTTADADGAAALKSAVTDAVGDTLTMLSAPPRIVVRTRAVGGTR